MIERPSEVTKKPAARIAVARVSALAAPRAVMKPGTAADAQTATLRPLQQDDADQRKHDHEVDDDEDGLHFRVSGSTTRLRGSCGSLHAFDGISKPVGASSAPMLHEGGHGGLRRPARLRVLPQCRGWLPALRLPISALRIGLRRILGVNARPTGNGRKRRKVREMQSLGFAGPARSRQGRGSGRHPRARRFADLHISRSLSVPRGVVESAAESDYAETEPELANARQKLILICRSGNRSALAALVLGDMGFTDVRSVKLGLRGWNDADLPLVNASDDTVDGDAAAALIDPPLRPDQTNPAGAKAQIDR